MAIISGGLWKNGRLMGITGNPAYFAVYLLFNAFLLFIFILKNIFRIKNSLIFG